MDIQPRAVPQLLNNNTSVEQCYKLAKTKGFHVFSLQNGQSCWATDRTSTFEKYGKGSGCKNGLGGFLRNDVYMITGKYRHRFILLKYF